MLIAMKHRKKIRACDRSTEHHDANCKRQKLEVDLKLVRSPNLCGAVIRIRPRELELELRSSYKYI